MKWIATLLCAVVAAATLHGADEQLNRAKDLYAAAAYEDALSVLSRVGDSPAGPTDSGRQADEYRAFCLYALGRTAEGDAVVESLVRKDPLFHIDTEDASPRVEAMFRAVRKRVLPGLIRDEYRAARAALEQKAAGGAETHFTQAKRMLVEAQDLGAWDDTLADLRVLVDGFLDLNRAAAETRHEEPLREAPVAVQASNAPAPAAVRANNVSAPAAGRANNAAAPAGRAAANAGAAAAVPPSAPAGVYSIADAEIVPPVTLRQEIPKAEAGLLRIMARKRGVLEVEIDEKGVVNRVVVVAPLQPMYDRQLVEAAYHWQYKPAQKNGQPVRYVKAIAINVGQ